MLQWLREKLTPARSERHDGDYPSVVVLLREPQFQPREEVVERAQKAWGAQQPVELKWIIHEGKSYILQSGPLTFAIHQNDIPYGIKLRGLSELQRLAWDQHKAWIAIDLPKLRTRTLSENGSLGMMYKVLTIYPFLFWSPNCLAIYFPAEVGKLVPNLDDLADSINWARRNGQNLDFLNTPKEPSK